MDVLLVSQEDDLLDTLSYALRCCGFTPHTASDEASALRRLQAVCPAVLVIDDGGVAYSGLATLRHVQAERTLPYIWLTPRRDHEPTELVPGCLAVVRKPFHLGELIAHLHALRRGTLDDGIDTLQSPEQADVGASH